MPLVVRPPLPAPVRVKSGVRLAVARISPRDVIDAEDCIAVVVVEGKDGAKRYEANYERYNRMNDRHIWRFPEGVRIEEDEEGWAFLEAVCPS